MARHIDSLSILPESLQGKDVWGTLSALFAEHGAAFAPGTSVIVNEYDGSDEEPKEADSEQEALARVTSWPSLGGFEYGLAGHKMTVFTFGTRPYQADVITLSTIATAYVMSSAFKTTFDALVRSVHRATNASRTICDSELLSPNSFWEGELNRVRRGSFVGTYSIDLRPSANNQ